MLAHYVFCSSGTGTDFTKACWKMLHQTCVFASSGICGSIVHSSESTVQNVDAVYFMLGWDQNGFLKRCARTRYAELIFSHLVGYAGRIVHSAKFGA
jgi:hypothetical protein